MAQSNGERLMEYVNVGEVGKDSTAYIRDKARDWGFGAMLDYLDQDSTVEEYAPTGKETIQGKDLYPVGGYWNENKKWLQPTLIGGGALALVLGVVVASTK